ncbi:MAG: RNA 3'-terminal phosphate cyclase, partial [Armatimonadota bacterium]
LWPLAFAGHPSRLTIRGGTHVPYAPTSNYIEDVFLPTVARMGLICHFYMERAGYYPIGGGEVRLNIEPVKALRPVSLIERSESMNVHLTSAVSNLPEHIAERQLNTGLARLKSLGLQPSGETTRYPSPGKGTVFFILASFDDTKAGFQSLGELRKRAEAVAEDACDEFAAYWQSGTALDKHLSDQLIIPIALAGGLSAFTTCEITQHLLTNIAVVERFLDVRFAVQGELGQPGTVRRIR